MPGRSGPHAGADLIVAHMGVTTGGSIGAKSSKTLDDCVTRIQDISDAAPTSGLQQTSTVSAGRDWQGTRLVAPRAGRR